ncbi:MAG: NAD-dependent epimerase/dehydratase family protein [Janthinobacterium lividum]
MRVFVTGATSFMGAAAVQELLGAGHQVLGLACSETTGQALFAVGAEVHRGDLADRDSWRRGVEAADAVLHLAGSPGAAPGEATGAANWRVIKSFGAILAGSDRPLVVTSALGTAAPGRLVREDDWLPPDGPPPWGATEQAAAAVATAGVRVSVVRLPPAVHGEGGGEFVAALCQLARATGVAAYPEGGGYWPAVHRRDAARLLRLVLEHPPALGARWHAVAEAGVAARAVAEAIGRRLYLPVVSQSAATAAGHFGGLAPFAEPARPAAGQHPQQQLGCWPQQPGLLATLAGDTCCAW